MDDQPWVSVIIPTYNRAKKVGAAIESVIRQTYPNKQIIVVDDGSDDDTSFVVKAYPEVEYVYQDHAGQGAARNTGLRRAAGKFIASLDSDDVWNADFLRHCVEFIQAHELDFVFTNWFQQSKGGEWMDAFSRYDFLKPFLTENKGKWILLDYSKLRKLYIRNIPSPSSSLVIRRSSIVTGWNEKMNIGDDVCLLLDMILAKECRAAFTKEKLWTKQIDGSNIYDGRDTAETIKLLDIEDNSLLIQRYRDQLRKHEVRILRRKNATGIMALAWHYLIRKRDVEEGRRMLKQIATLNRGMVTFLLFRLFYHKCSYHLKKTVALAKKLGIHTKKIIALKSIYE